MKGIYNFHIHFFTISLGFNVCILCILSAKGRKKSC